MNAQKRKKIFTRLQAVCQNPTTELIYHSSFELLIAVMLSAQATDVSVNKCTIHLFRMAPTAQAMLELGIDKVMECIRTIGLYKTKAKHVMETCRILVQQYNGDVPQTREELEALPGVGRKTANVVLNTAFGHPTIAVDTHIFRVCNRTGLAPGKTVREVEDKLMQVVPKQFRLNAHHWLILHGRYICKARKPLCEQCLINDLCEYPAKSTLTV